MAALSGHHEAPGALATASTGNVPTSSAVARGLGRDASGGATAQGLSASTSSSGTGYANGYSQSQGDGTMMSSAR